MESPTVKFTKQQPKKKAEVDEGLKELRGSTPIFHQKMPDKPCHDLRANSHPGQPNVAMTTCELRGIAVRIEAQERAGDKKGQDLTQEQIQNTQKPSARMQMQISAQVPNDTDGFEYKSGYASSMSRAGMQVASALSHVDEHNYKEFIKLHGMGPPVIKASPRFSEVNPKVGQIMSLNNRLAGLTRPSVNYALGSTFDPYIRSIANTETQSDATNVQSKFVATKRQLAIAPSRGRNAQSLTVEVRGKVRTSDSNKRQKRQSMDVGHHMAIALPDSLPKVSMTQSEQLALRNANPQYHQFAGLISKVIASVQNRRKQNFKFEKDDDQLLMITDGQLSSQRDPISPLRQSDQYLMDATELSEAKEQRSKFEKPAEIVAAARQLALAETIDKKQNLAQMLENLKKEQPRSVEQVSKLMEQLRTDQRLEEKRKVFIPLEAQTINYGQAMIFKETKNPRVVEPGNVVFSNNGFLKVAQNKNEMTDFITKEAFIEDGVQSMVLCNVPFFKKFHLLKAFKQWRYEMRTSYYTKTRERLAKNFIFARPIFMERYRSLHKRVSQVEELKFLEIKKKQVYGKQQPLMLDDRCNKLVEESREVIKRVVVNVRKQLEELKEEITEDDRLYLKAVQQSHLEEVLKTKANKQELVMFSQAKKQLQEEEEQKCLIKQRHCHFNQLCQLVARMIGNMLVESLYANKKEFQQTFCTTDKQDQTQFELFLCLNEQGRLDSDPTFAAHRAMFAKVIQNMEDSVFENRQLINALQDLPELFFTEAQSAARRHQAATYMGNMVELIQELLNRKVLIEYELGQDTLDRIKAAGWHSVIPLKRTTYASFQTLIQQQLDQDIAKCQKQFDKHKCIEQVEEHRISWENKPAAARNDSEIYKETRQKMKQFKDMIKEIPDKIKHGTITIECITLRKYLTKIPQVTMESLQNNQKGMLMEDTKQLREELTKVTEVLEQPPVTLNIYVDQKNTLKYADQKDEEFRDRWKKVEELYKDYIKDGNFKLDRELEDNKKDVQKLFDQLPEKKERAKSNLLHNKAKMEEIIKTSSLALSNKIKSFEQKYVQSYHLEKERMDECAETLDELFRRSTAIHEIRSKVILYKEFLKVLYENDPATEQRLTDASLTCVKDCENLQDIHKHTIRLWKYLLFWRKRRKLCYETPFLQLDLNVVMKAITKITNFFETKLKENSTVEHNSRPLKLTVEQQVKQTNLIVEFAKNLHKDALQRRHWIQIFTVLKAAHLKNSTTFTIVDLKEYNIEKYQDEISKIISQAHTESRYESYFLSIKKEWEKAELKIVPFKDTLKDYVITNTDTMIEAIEENIGMLESISRSKHVSHIQKEVVELQDMLKQMLRHLKEWVAAQKYWVTLDPIYNSGVFKNFFGDKTQQFRLLRDQFRRIVWSAFRNPKATYNLMIEDRIKVFKELIEYYDRLQKMVHDFLEKKRLEFTRFFFLNDSQFLDFMMQVSSNLDFSVYINFMFRGAQKLFVTQIKQAQHLKLYGREDSLGFEASIMDDQSQYRSQLSDELDIEAKLEMFLKSNYQQGEEKIREDSIKSPMMPRSHRTKNTFKNSQNPRELDFAMPSLNQLDPIYKVASDDRLNSDDTDEEPGNDPAHNEAASESLATSQEFSVIQSDNESHKRLMDEINASDHSANTVITLKDFYAIGMISPNKELFLFDRHIQISRQPEQWLCQVETAMKSTIRQQLKNSVERFGYQPIEEWVLDYPQQVVISSLHLILTQEIGDLLSGVQYEEEEEGFDQNFFENKIMVGGISETVGGRRSSDVTDNSQGKSKDLASQASERKAKKGSDLEFRAKIIRAKKMREIYDEEEDRKMFFDEAFGEGVWTRLEKHYEEAEQAYRKVESRQSSTNKRSKVNKPEFKEIFLRVLQHSNKHSLFLRLAFWINKMVKLMFKQRKEGPGQETINFDPQGVSKRQIKSVVLFLRYMQDMICRLIDLKVQAADDFEWQYKLKTNWNSNDEGEVQCGGWRMQMGYEYLASQNRILIMPCTERYFLFIASSLREKNAVMFQCVPKMESASFIVEEFAAFAAVPFRQVQCGTHMNLSFITQLLNGCALANFWIFLEHMDLLQMNSLSILIKEIQLIQEQFAVRMYQSTVKVEQNFWHARDENSVSNRSIAFDFGVFGSISTKIGKENSAFQSSVLEQVRSTFRIRQLYKPDINVAIRQYLFVENFYAPDEDDRIISDFFKNFERIMKEQLYGGQTFSQTDILHEDVNVLNIRTAIKYATLLRNQEWSAFFSSQMRLAEKEAKATEQMDKFECITRFSESQNNWRTLKKTKADFIVQLRAKEARQGTLMKEQIKIELNALLQGFRIILKQRSQNEWLQARTRNADWMKANDNNADMLIIEAEIDRTIQQAFKETIEFIKKENETQESGRAGSQLDEGDQAQDDDGAKTPYVPPAKKTQRQLIRIETLRDVKLDQFVTPIVKKMQWYQPGVLTKHSTHVDLRHSSERQRIEEEIRTKFNAKVKEQGERLGLSLEEHHYYKCLSILQLMRRTKGIVIIGPQTSGKTQLLKLFNLALWECFNITLKTRAIHPQSFTDKELFGPKLAFEENTHDAQVKTKELQTQSVFQVIFNTFEREKLELDKGEAKRVLHSIVIDQQSVQIELSDCLTQFLKVTNIRERDYQKETEFLMQVHETNKKVQPDVSMQVPVRFPNGNVTMFPSEIVLIFETQSLQHASPSFIANIGIVHTQETDVTKDSLFMKLKKNMQVKHSKFFTDNKIDFKIVEEKFDEFVIPFLNVLNQQPLIKQCPLWNNKHQTAQFFTILNGLLHRLNENIELNRNNDDIDEYPFFEDTVKDTMDNVILCAFVWGYGAVLNKELRRIFDDKFNMQFKTKFLNLHGRGHKAKGFNLFEYFFDVERLYWTLVTEKLEFRLKLYFDSNMQQVYIPSTEISQALFIQDLLVYSGTKEKDLNKHLRLIGPSSSSKTVILQTFANRISTPTKTVHIPVSAFVSTAKIRQIIEDHYIPQRRNWLVPKDDKKRLVLVIDDVHMLRNIKVELLEYLRSWAIIGGYYDVQAGYFKRVEDFTTIMAENIDFVSTAKKTQRFMSLTTTLYCEEITIDKFKPFIQTWLTSALWGNSPLVTKFYILITNALVSLCDKMKRNDSFFNSSFSKLIKFQYVAKFCQNIVQNSMHTEASDVFGNSDPKRREEDAIADIFCYEAMRCFGDRIMRPGFRTEFLGKLAEICQKEFLCSKNYSASYIENLILGNYHSRDPKEPMKMTNVSAPHQRIEATQAILEKCNSLSGNQLLQSLLDSPTGLNDLYRISRILFKEKQHLTLIGLSGTSKHELIQLCTLINQNVCFEIDTPCYGKPVQFANAFKTALVAAAKLSHVPVIILINDTQLRDPVYFDYIFNFMQNYAHFEEFMLFDKDLCDRFAAAEANYIKKLKKVAMPGYEVLWRQAAAKVRKNVHIVFSFSDLMTYKEIFSLFPQFEYLTEVMFLDDLSPLGYLAMVDSFLARSQLGLIDQDQNISKAMRDVRNHARRQLQLSFYSNKMLKAAVFEHCINFGSAEYIFPDDQKVMGNIFAGPGGFTVMDKDLRVTLLNMPLPLAALNKHRFGMFLELFRYLYDLIGMHLSIHKAYYETFIAKSNQFKKYYESVKTSKLNLHGDSSDHTFKEVQASEQIERMKKLIEEKEKGIGTKATEIKELRDDLHILEQQIMDVSKAKKKNLDRIRDEFDGITQTDWMSLVTENPAGAKHLSAMYDVLQIIITQDENAEMTDDDKIEWFINTPDVFVEKLDEIAQLSLETFSPACFSKLAKFIETYNNNDKFEKVQLYNLLYSYLRELQRKHNIKKTMESTFVQMKEASARIEANNFLIELSRKQITSLKAQLVEQVEKYHALNDGRFRLSRKVEEAEISYMRTEHIFDQVMSYSKKIEGKLKNIQERQQSLLGDCILLAASVTMIGCFSPEERDKVRSEIIKDIEHKQHKIECNRAWDAVVQSSTAKKHQSMFQQVLKDLGLSQILRKSERPSIISENDFYESLFCILFAPSCPVVCDPTGEMEKYVREKFLSNFGQEKISAADIGGNGKLENVLQTNRAAIITDLNLQHQINGGLSLDQQLFKRISGTIFNGVDFNEVRVASLKKVNAIQPFFDFFSSQNKRVQTTGNFENISIHQAQIFQPSFDMTLNEDFVQNATFICAAPTISIRNKFLAHNNAVRDLKLLFMRNLLPNYDEHALNEKKFAEVKERLPSLKKDFENAFLVASGDTLKKLAEYQQLQAAVQNVVDAQEKSRELKAAIEEAEQKVELINEVTKILYQMYIALKITSKVMLEVTYSWRQFLKIVEYVLQKALNKLKKAELEKNKPDSSMDLHDPSEIRPPQTAIFRQQVSIEIEIGKDFFRENLLPTTHKLLMSNIRLQSIGVFNMILALRLALQFETVKMQEYHFILSQFTKLKDFYRWRDNDHHFVRLLDSIEKSQMQELRKELMTIYPDIGREVFNFLDTRIGKEYTFQKATRVYSEELPQKFPQLTPLQQICFGFMCPDNEFKAKLTLFMYSQVESTFTFREDVNTFQEFINFANWHNPIALFSYPDINSVNLVTSVALKNGNGLKLLRIDPLSVAQHHKDRIENQAINQHINDNLLDLTNVRATAMSMDYSKTENMAHYTAISTQTDQVISKQFWLSTRLRNVNLDEGAVVNEIDFERETDKTIESIVECARDGTWVLICPIQFPQYSWKLFRILEQMHANGEINPRFRLIYDFQGLMMNEIPESFLFEKSITFHIGSHNVDEMPTFNDIWAKILQPEYMEVLTSDVNGREVIRNAQLQTQWATLESENVIALYSDRIKDPTLIETFKAYLVAQKQMYREKLAKQEHQRFVELEKKKHLERLRLEEEERQKLLQMAVISQAKEDAAAAKDEAEKSSATGSMHIPHNILLSRESLRLNSELDTNPTGLQATSLEDAMLHIQRAQSANHGFNQDLGLIEQQLVTDQSLPRMQEIDQEIEIKGQSTPEKDV